MKKWCVIGLAVLLPPVQDAVGQVNSFLPPTALNSSLKDKETSADAEQSDIQTVSYMDALSGNNNANWCGAETGCGCGEGCSCGGSGCSSSGCGSGCGLSWLNGLTFKSDRCFDDFIEPVSNPSFLKILGHAHACE
ncbi:MAG: hypothetical protein R3C59_13330 [Planctomycetaceae bacterium]